ncbi:MAG: elongator complex protein 3 [Intestinibacillus sp.]
MARKAILPVFVPHFGCPCQCVFCNQRAIAGQAEPVTAADVRRAAEEARQNGLAKPEIAFYGGSFTAIAAETQERLLAAAAGCVRDGLSSGIRLSTRPDCVDEAVCTRLQKYGVGTVELGAQSMNDDVLRLAGRGHTTANTVYAAGRLRQEGFCVILQLMAGLPGETDAIARESARRAAALCPDGVRLYPVAVLPHTALYDQWRAGAYEPLTVEQAACRCADMLEVFEERSVSVLRVGLNPTEELGTQVAAGAYHPAMGELAWNEVWLRRMQSLLAPYRGRRGEAVFEVPPRAVSKAVGQKRRNLTRLAAAFPGVRMRICAAEGATGPVLRFTARE